MFEVEIEPAHGNVNISLLTSVKNEPSMIKEEPPDASESSSDQRTNRNYGVALLERPYTNVKVETLEDAPFSEDGGSLGPGRSPHIVNIVKNEPTIIKIEEYSPDASESSSDQLTNSNFWTSHPDSPYTHVKVETLDVAPFLEFGGSVEPGPTPLTAACTENQVDIRTTELQPPGEHFPLTQSHHYPLCVVEDIPQGHELVVLKGEKFTRKPDNDLKMYNSPGSLPQGMCRPMSQQDTRRIKIVSGPAHTKTSTQRKPINIELMDSTPGNSAPTEFRDTSQSPDDNPNDNGHPRKFECDYCHKVISWKSNFLRHMRLHNYDKYSITTTEPPLQKICYDNPSETFPCHEIVPFESTLDTHKQVHKREKPYECRLCGKIIKHSSDFTRHMRMHSGEKPFQCNLCSKKYNHSSHLTAHLRNHTGEKPFDCENCGKRFATRSSLNVHMRVHTGEKPFDCKFCDKRFNTRSKLKSHMLVHAKVSKKPYECTSCGTLFNMKCRLNRHMRVHTGEKPFECELCGKSFNQSSNLTRHKQRHST